MRFGEGTSPGVEAIGRDILDCAFRVHTGVGPGLLEVYYQVCLAHELRKIGRTVEREKRLPFTYRRHPV